MIRDDERLTKREVVALEILKAMFSGDTRYSLGKPIETLNLAFGIADGFIALGDRSEREIANAREEARRATERARGH